MPKNIEILMTKLEFPENLEDPYCAFRPLIKVRYLDDDGVLQEKQEVIPGLRREDYWECELGNHKAHNFVRLDHHVDFSRVAEAERKVTFSDAKMSRALELVVKIYDVEKDKFWDKFGKKLAGVAPEIAAAIGGSIPKTLAQVLLAYDTATEKPEVSKEDLIEKVLGTTDGGARRIWTGSSKLTGASQNLSLTSTSNFGEFTVDIKVTTF